MRIKEFLTIEEVAAAAGNLDQEVNGLTYDSRKVSVGDIFFAVPGEKADGHDFIAEAVRRNAAAVVFSREGNWPRATASVRVNDVRRTLGLWEENFFNHHCLGLEVVVVYGSNGKTIISILIA